MRKTLLLLFLFAGSLSAQQLEYEVNLHTSATHKVQVFVNFKKLSSKTFTYQMPIWAPGAYSVTHYGHYVTDFEAHDRQMRPLAVKQIDGDRWEVPDAKNLSGISYFVGDSHKDSTSLYFALANIDTNFFFANGTCLFGYVNDKKNIPSIVTYNIPKDWQLATALDSFAFRMWTSDLDKYYELRPKNNVLTFKAKNYDKLADAPVMAGTGFQTRSFRDGKARYDIVLASDREFPMDSLAEYTHKIVHAETEFFHDTPFDHYTFLIYAPSYSRSSMNGQGALEHANSSAYLLVNLPWSTFKQFGPEILSHEFFHLWNVKRIHSSLLGPFDYTKRVMTTSLWLSEGITDYYAHTILTRWNILKPRSFELMLSELTGAVDRSQAAQTKTLEELSIAESDFDLGNAVVFYSKGTLVGLMLDIEIRSRTNNKKSLDDVMLALNAEAKKGKTFKDSLLIGKMEKITGLDLQDFYKKYIAGTEELPMDDYLKKMGIIDITDTADKHKGFVGDNFLGDVKPILHEMHPGDKQQFVFYRVPTGGSVERAGIQVGDTILQVNDEPLTMDKFIEIAHTFKPPVKYELDLATAIGHRHVTISYEKPQRRHRGSHDYAPDPDATPLQVAIRHGIVGEGY